MKRVQADNRPEIGLTRDLQFGKCDWVASTERVLQMTAIFGAIVTVDVIDGERRNAPDICADAHFVSWHVVQVQLLSVLIPDHFCHVGRVGIERAPHLHRRRLVHRNRADRLNGHRRRVCQAKNKSISSSSSTMLDSLLLKVWPISRPENLYLDANANMSFGIANQLMDESEWTAHLQGLTA